jgi:hypothetical protein
MFVVIRPVSLFLFFLFSFAALRAQSNAAIRLNLQGAPLFCKQVYPFYPDAGWIMGYSLLMNVGFRFTPELGLDLGLGYTRQGARDDTLLNFNIGGGTLKKKQVFTLQSEYLKIPCLFRYTTPEGPVRFFMVMGPQLGIKLNKQLLLPDINYQEIQVGKQTIDAAPYYKNVILEIAIGMGLEFRITESFALYTEARFEYSFTDIRRDKPDSFGNISLLQTYTTQEGLKFDRPLTPATTRNLALGWHIGLSFLLAR